MQMLMQTNLVYRYPIWIVACVMVGLAALATVILELGVRRFLPAESRHEYNDATAGVFSVIGVTFAVLLAFVATAAWENFNKAKAASYTEAICALDVDDALAGLAGPERMAMHGELVAYLKTVTNVEWPAQDKGQIIDYASAKLDGLIRQAIRLKPSDLADPDLHGLLLQSLIRLRDARQNRMLAAQTAVPAVVWIVTIIGGAITIAFSSFLGVANLTLHLAMACTLAISGVLVLIMILALSNPFRGDFRIPFEQVLERVQSAGAAP